MEYNLKELIDKWHQGTWYDNNIEPGIRKLVYQLRNNGINTICSCAHKRYVECVNTQDSDVAVIRSIMFALGYNEVGFKITREQICNDVQNTDRLYIEWDKQHIV